MLLWLTSMLDAVTCSRRASLICKSTPSFSGTAVCENQTHGKVIQSLLLQVRQSSEQSHLFHSHSASPPPPREPQFRLMYLCDRFASHCLWTCTLIRSSGYSSTLSLATDSHFNDAVQLISLWEKSTWTGQKWFPLPGSKTSFETSFFCCRMQSLKIIFFPSGGKHFSVICEKKHACVKLVCLSCHFMDKIHCQLCGIRRAHFWLHPRHDKRSHSNLPCRR